MPRRSSPTGSELFIVDNSDDDWKVLRYLHDWCQISKSIDIATGYFEIGSLLALEDEWQKVDQIRILMGDEVSRRTQERLCRGVGASATSASTTALRAKRKRTPFSPASPQSWKRSVPARYVSCLPQGQIPRQGLHHPCAARSRRLLRPRRLSNFTFPGLTENIELNVQITGQPVAVLAGVVRAALG